MRGNADQTFQPKECLLKEKPKNQIPECSLIFLTLKFILESNSDTNLQSFSVEDIRHSAKLDKNTLANLQSNSVYIFD